MSMADDQRAGMNEAEALLSPLDPGPPWAKITPARWGFWVTFGIAPLAMTMSSVDGGEKRWWRRTREGAERKAQHLIDEEWRARRPVGWMYKPVDEDLLIEKLLPFDGNNVLVLRGVDPEAAADLAKALIDKVKACGVTGAAAHHLPLILAFDSPDQSLAVLSEEDMAREGWVRA